MNIFINTIYHTDITTKGAEKRFPLIYFWLKDYYFQRSPGNFAKIKDWSFSDDPTPIKDNPALQQQLFNTPPDIVGFSLYLWNESVLLENAEWIKQNFPKCIIVAGGPNADTREAWMREHHYIDAVVPGPAAETFRLIVDTHLVGGNITKVAGVNHWNGHSCVRNSPVPRSEDPLVLDYVTNFNDEVRTLLDQYTKDYNKVVFLTMYIQGCPYSCSFCEQGTSLWTKIHKRDITKLYKEIDLLAEYNNCVYEFADANFGIVPEYEDILDYVIENAQGKLSFRKPPLAKNQIEFTTYLMQKMEDSGIYDDDEAGNYGKITLQDPNPEIVKMNGRPFNKEYEKIKAFQAFTKNDEHKTGQIEIILGMPGQSYNTLTDSLHELQKNDLLSHFLPFWYLIFPNTVLTSPGNTYQFKSNKNYIRSERHYSRSLLDQPGDSAQITWNHMIETETLTTEELAASWYHWTMMCHTYGFLGWMRTPINYLENHHGVSSHEFIKAYTRQFHPSNWKNLPDSFRLDLELYVHWLTGKNKLYQRYDNTGTYPINPRRVSQYRFHASPDDFMTIFSNIFHSLINVQKDPNIKDLFRWQRAKIMNFDTGHKQRMNKIISYNFDDVAFNQDEKYYKSIWQFKWPKEDVYNLTLGLKKVQFIPSVIWEELKDESLQQELKQKLIA